MANPFTEYLRETRAELRHVAWPTQTQTIVYTVLVAAISVGIAVYLGFFDYIFTTTLGRFLGALPGGTTPAAQVQPVASGSPITVTQSPAAPSAQAQTSASSPATAK